MKRLKNSVHAVGLGDLIEIKKGALATKRYNVFELLNRNAIRICVNHHNLIILKKDDYKLIRKAGAKTCLHV